jgi:hypothetical protein
VRPFADIQPYSLLCQTNLDRAPRLQGLFVIVQYIFFAKLSFSSVVIQFCEKVVATVVVIVSMDCRLPIVIVQGTARVFVVVSPKPLDSYMTGCHLF